MHLGMIGLGRMGAGNIIDGGGAGFVDRVLSAMRKQFGGHDKKQGR